MTPRPTAALVPVTDALPAHPDADPWATLYDERAFSQAKRTAETLAQCPLVPQHLRESPQSIVAALAIAKAQGESPFHVLNSIYFVQGRACWSAQYLIAKVNGSGLIRGPIRYKEEGQGESLAVTAYAFLVEDGERIEFTCSLAMAHAEGWSKRNSKYRSAPSLMLRYRAATLLARTYFPHVLMGFHERNELVDTFGEAASYEEPDPLPPAPQPRPPSRSAEPAPPQGGARAQDERGDPPALLPSGEAGGDATETGSTPEQQHSTPSAPAPTASTPGGAAQGADAGEADAHRDRVLAEVAELRKECPDLLREEARSMGLKTSPAKTPTLRLQELVFSVRGRAPLLTLTDETLHERLHAAMAELTDQDYACTLALRFGLEVVDGRAVTDGAPRPWVERCLVTLVLVAAQEAQQRQRESAAARQDLLKRARLVLRELTEGAAEELFARLGLQELETATDEQLSAVIAEGDAP